MNERQSKGGGGGPRFISFPELPFNIIFYLFKQFDIFKYAIFSPLALKYKNIAGNDNLRISNEIMQNE